jgi:hypothetical protein
MNCLQCYKDLSADGDSVQCKSCKKYAHSDCARRATSLSTRSNKNAKFICKSCIVKQSDTGSQGSDIGDSNDEDSIKQWLMKIDRKYDAISEKLNDLSEIKKTVDFLATRYDELILQNNENKRLVSDLNKKMESMTVALKERDKKIDELNDRLNDLEQKQLDTYIEITGVPVKPNENMSTIVHQIAQVCDVQESNIVEAYRDASRRPNTIPPIVVQFSTVVAKNEWIRRKEGRKLTVDDIFENGVDSAVYINEQLTPYNKRLLWQAKQRGKEKHYKFIWTRNGKIFARSREEMGVVRLRNELEIVQKIV